MSVNDYWIAKMRATEAGGEETEEADVETQSAEDDSEEEEVEEPQPILVDENYRPVADPDNHAGEVFEYNPQQSPEDFVGGPDAVSEPPEPNYDPEIPPGEEPVPAETVDPDDVEEGELVEGTDLAPGLIDEEEQEKRKAAEAEAAENAIKNQQAALEANAIAVTPEEDPNEDTPAETVLPEEEEEAESPDDDAEEVEFVDAPEDEEPEEDQPVPEEDTYEATKARVTAEVPTQANNKQAIRDYLTYKHGVDPDDLQDQTKAELLDLVADLDK